MPPEKLVASLKFTLAMAVKKKIVRFCARRARGRKLEKRE